MSFDFSIDLAINVKYMKVAQVDYNDKNAKKDFARSLKETGFAVLANHPVPVDLIFDTFDEWAKFFGSEEKHKYTFDPKIQSGYFPFKSENAKNYDKKDLKEFFHYFSWNELPAGMSSKAKQLFDRLTILAKELLTWVDEETPSEIRSKFSMPLGQMIEGSRETLLRAIHYPPLSGSEEEGAIRAAAHEDINLITLLPAATAPGLQVKDTSGNWHDVPCDPGNLAINAGDMLQMASKGYYISTTHRVVNPIGPEARKPRYSMPLFLHPRADVKLSETQTARNYLDERLREIGLKK